MNHATDYLVVGAGASGLAFVDSLITESDASIVVVDRRDDVGGHWCDTYPFVQLHTPSAYYGVNSIPLGEDRLQESGRNAGFYEQATGPELQAYFRRVLQERLLPSQQVTFLPHHDYLGSSHGIAKLRDLNTDTAHEITVRQKVVDARYQQASVPATHTPSFSVDDHAAFIPIGQLSTRAGDYDSFIVIGAGKTSVDACLWLLDAGMAPEQIRWVRPREAWFLDRAQLQPFEQVGALMEGAAHEAEAGANATDVPDLFHRLEKAGRVMRLNEDLEPTMYRVTMLSRRELADLKKITGVIRRGHVRAVEPKYLAFDDGLLSIGTKELMVDCSAYGLAPAPPVPIFRQDAIVLQQIRHASPTFNAALIAFLEAHRDTDDERNWLAPPNGYTSKPADILMMLIHTWDAAERWRGVPDVKEWISHSRLNLTRGLSAHMNDPRVRAAVERYVTNLPKARKNMLALARS